MGAKSLISIASGSRWWTAGALLGASAVVAGAFGAHALKKSFSTRPDRESEKLLKTWETAAHYRLLTAPVLLMVPFCRRPNLAGSLLTTGVLLFSGSLYTMVLFDTKKLGMVTPIGGISLILGWLALML